MGKLEDRDKAKKAKQKERELYKNKSSNSDYAKCSQCDFWRGSEYKRCLDCGKHFLSRKKA